MKNMTIHSQQTVYCTPRTICAKADVSLACLTEVVAAKSLPAILGGNDSVEGQSIFAAEPVEVFEFSLHQSAPFEKLRNVLSKYQKKGSGTFSGFSCGWIGYFGYELGRFIEKLPAGAVDDLGFPVIRLGFYDKAILYDHPTGEFTLTALECEGQSETAAEKFAVLNGWFDQARAASVPALANANIESIAADTVASNMTKAMYLEAIAKIKHYIIEGDTYQINLSQRFEKPFSARPVDVFHWQNRFNPSPFAAYLAWDDRAVVSASPELFLEVAGQTITTKPIKGTRPRNPLLPDQSPENAKHFHDLVMSEKEQAELAMIVDLERNDLARMCLPGTRGVSCGRQIEAFPTVYHAVATVRGQLALPPGPQRIVEILKASFPGGSITGAPKIRSMEIIDELEPTARGVYTGSVGWIGLNFDLCWHIAIRTVLISGQKAYIQAGGGIVADSDSHAEWDETLTKALALLAGIDAVNAWES
ncbi:MAG: aminodeoxychorismate synthase, component I [Planctomycetota bacterium]|nr:MAG: aminodeoxychorismate synthase, component I [Planctomycetota bacterium]